MTSFTMYCCYSWSTVRVHHWMVKICGKQGRINKATGSWLMPERSVKKESALVLIPVQFRFLFHCRLDFCKRKAERLPVPLCNR